MGDFSEHLAAVGEAVDDHLADDATWTGVADPVRVQHFEEDALAEFSSSRAVRRTHQLQVRKSLIPAPAVDDEAVLTGSGRRFRVIADPVLDGDGFWLCEAKEITS